MNRESDPRYEDFYRKKFLNHLEFNPPSMEVPEGVGRVLVFCDDDVFFVHLDTGHWHEDITEKHFCSINRFEESVTGWLPADEIKCSVKEVEE